MLVIFFKLSTIFEGSDIIYQIVSADKICLYLGNHVHKIETRSASTVINLYEFHILVMTSTGSSCLLHICCLTVLSLIMKHGLLLSMSLVWSGLVFRWIVWPRMLIYVEMVLFSVFVDCTSVCYGVFFHTRSSSSASLKGELLCYG